MAEIKIKVEIPAQTKYCTIEVGEGENQQAIIDCYLDGCLDANIFPQGYTDRGIKGYLEPQGEHSGLDALDCTISLDNS